MIGHINTPATWWGNFKVNIDQSRQWQIGPLTLIIRRLLSEWQIAYERDDEFNSNNVDWETSETDTLPETLDNNSRFVFRRTTDQLTITPRLADRSVISRPLTPFNLTAGEEVTLYVSTPLWVGLTAGDDSKNMLQEIAIQRPSDTWFGPSTREGELCYASTTHCRLNVDDLPHRPHRAITPVRILNQADSTLAVERLNVPTPLLALYACADGQLWTPEIILNRESDGDLAKLKIAPKPPQEAQQTVQLCEPRNKADSGALIRAFSAVFS